MTITNLNVFVANTLAEVEPVNENFETIRLAVNSNESKIGNLGVLNTTSKANIVSAINSCIDTFNSNLRAVMPVGGIISVVTENAPSGYLLCNGALISRTVYSDLFSAIGTTFGEGDGSTTFAIPDFRGYFLRGYSDDITEAIGTAQASGLPNITGTVSIRGQSQGGSGVFYTEDTTYGRYKLEDGAAQIWKMDASLGNSIYGAASEVRPMNYAVNFCIKY